MRFIKMQRLAMLMPVAAMLLLSACDHYNCSSGANFGASSCTSSGSGLGTGTTGGSATAAFAFAVDTAGGSSNGTIDGYTLNTTANTFAATPSYAAPSIPTNDGGVGMVVAQSQYLYAGFGLAGELYGWSIDSTGNLTAISGSPYTEAFMSGVGGDGGINSIITNPAGTLLFLADTDSDQIYVFQIGTGGALTPVSGSPFSVPLSPVNLATDGLGKYLYMTNPDSSHVGSEIAAYSIGTTGALTAVSGSPFITSGSASYSMWQVQGEPTGKYLIGTTGRNADINGADDDNLYVYAISSTGAITPVSGSPFATQFSPYNIAVQPNSTGNLVYSFSINDTLTGFNGIEGYSIDSTSGALSAVSGSPFTGGTLGSWGQFDQSGAFLFVYSKVDDNGTFAYTLSPFDVASTGTLTDPISGTSLIDSGFWVVTDPPAAQ
jgi:6-phosphogluconolactonase (cycloisomerase 2 family)